MFVCCVVDYFICNSPAITFNEAQEYCNDTYGTSLATIDSSDKSLWAQHQYQIINSIDSSSFSWIGVTSYRYQYNSFAPTEPSGTIDCVWLAGDGLWYETDCDSISYSFFICNNPSLVLYNIYILFLVHIL